MISSACPGWLYHIMVPAAVFHLGTAACYILQASDEGSKYPIYCITILTNYMTPHPVILPPISAQTSRFPVANVSCPTLGNVGKKSIFIQQLKSKLPAFLFYSNPLWQLFHGRQPWVILSCIEGLNPFSLMPSCCTYRCILLSPAQELLRELETPGNT